MRSRTTGYCPQVARRAREDASGLPEGVQARSDHESIPYENLAQLYEQLDEDADAIRIDEQLLAHDTKLGSAFAMDLTNTTNELARLRAKPKQPKPKR